MKRLSWANLGFLQGGRGAPFYGEHGKASLYGGLGGVPPVESRGKAPSGGLGGRSLSKADAYFYWKKPKLK